MTPFESRNTGDPLHLATGASVASVESRNRFASAPRESCPRCRAEAAGEPVRWYRRPDMYTACDEHYRDWYAAEARYWPPVSARPCAECGRTLLRNQLVYCCPSCAHDGDLRRQRAIRAANRPPKVCERCGTPLEGTRADARFCSARCRVAAHRAAQRADEA